MSQTNKMKKTKTIKLKTARPKARADKLQMALLAASMALTGCEMMGPSLSSKRPLDEVKSVPSQSEAAGGPYYRELENVEDSGEGQVAEEIYRGTGDFVTSPDGRKPIPAAPKRGRYTLNFDDADLGEVTKVILGDTLNQNYVMNPKVAGRVTLQTSQPLTEEELIPTLEMLLRMNGSVLIKAPGGYRIDPAADALQGAKSPRLALPGRRLPPGYQIRVVPLRFVGIQEMQKILEPMLPPKAILYTDKVRNLMLVAGTGSELENIVDTIAVFDVDVMRGMSVGLFPLKNVDVATIITELGTLVGEGEENPLSGMFRMLPIERLNAVMVITPQPRYLDDARLWIERLDRTNTAAGGKVNVYRVQNMDAVELADTLNEIFAKAGKKSTPEAKLAPGLKAAEVSSKKDTQKPRTPTGRVDVADIGEVRIIPDEINNTIVIIATAQEYEAIETVIKQLDVPPLQVLIDATIVEVTLTDNLRYGIQWLFNSGSSTASFTTANDGSVGSNFPGFSYSLVNSAADVRVVLNSLTEDSKANVVSSPSLMVLNNQEATIKVGDQVPIRSSESTNTNDSTNPIRTSSIQMRDTGVTLKVKPRVNAGGLVTMEVEQQVDDVVRTDTSDIDSPTIQQRQIETSVAVKSGETIVLGGLISDRRERSHSGVPFLSNLPLIGPLFGATDKSLDRTELVVLITPRVAQNGNDVREITHEFKRKLSGIYDEMARAGDSKDAAEGADAETGEGGTEASPAGTD